MITRIELIVVDNIKYLIQNGIVELVGAALASENAQQNKIGTKSIINILSHGISILLASFSELQEWQTKVKQITKHYRIFERAFEIYPPVETLSALQNS